MYQTSHNLHKQVHLLLMSLLAAVAAPYFRFLYLVGEGIVRTEHMSTGFFLAQDFLVTLSSSNVLRIRVLDKIWKRKFLLHHSEKPGIIHFPLTKLYIILAKFIYPEESSVEDLRRPLEGVEGDVELVVGAEYHEVPHLAAIGS